MELSAPIETTKELLINFPADCYSAEKIDQHNGDFIVRYKVKVSGEAILTQGSEKMAAKGSSSQSKLTRGAIYALQIEMERLEVDQNVFYESMQKLIRRHLPEIYKQYEKELTF